MLIYTEKNFDETYLIKSIKDLVIIPTSVGTLDGSILSTYTMDTTEVLAHHPPPLKLKLLILRNWIPNWRLYRACDYRSFYDQKGFLVTSEWSGVYYNECSATMNLLSLTSPSNPSIVATEVLAYPLNNMYPIKDGKYSISINDQLIWEENATRITVCLYQVANKSLKQVGAYRLIIPVISAEYSYFFGVNDDRNFQGFYVYDVNFVNGLKFIGNVTHEFANLCYFHPAESMVFNGDLVPFMGDTIKSTSNLTMLSNLKWELENYCGFF